MSNGTRAKHRVDAKQLKGMWYDLSAFESGRFWLGPSKGTTAVVGRFLATNGRLEESEDLACKHCIRVVGSNILLYSISV